MSETALCVLSDRHDEPVPASPGLSVCGRCRAYVLRLLEDIGEAWPVVLGRVRPLRRGRSVGGRGQLGPSSPANDHVLSLTDWRTTIAGDRDPVSAPAVIAGWVEVIKSERGTELTGHPDVPAGIAYLTTHVDHLCAASWAADAVEELATVSRHCRGLLGDSRSPAVRVCPGGAGRPCSGTLRLTADHRALACTRCCREWACPDWLELAEADPGAVLVSVRELAAFYGVPDGTMRRWASMEDWPRYGTRGARLYALSDAQRSYSAKYGRLVS